MVAGPTWTDADQAHHIKTEKEHLVELLKEQYNAFSYVNELLDCIDALRHELIAWAEGR
jgi:hypothetical protein